MGDPRRIRKKYRTPNHPWERSRIEEETALVKEYGLKNKREVWKMRSVLKNYTMQAKRLIAAQGTQAEKEKAQLLARLQKYGLFQAGSSFDSVLNLQLRDILERRLQTQVYKKNLARSMSQSRQFIIHQHIMINSQKVTMPSYLVPIMEEHAISFSPRSTLSDKEHPERVMRSESAVKKEKQSEEQASAAEAPPTGKEPAKK